jgi:D-glycerate 3-kinase
MQDKVEIVSQFILSIVNSHSSSSPLIVGLSGAQGSGKSTLSSQLSSYLLKHHSLSCIVLSLDDFYHDYETIHGSSSAWRKEVARGNTLLQGRGNPGTHNVELLTTMLELCLGGKEAQEPGAYVLTPRYDKSAHAGKGDRMPRDKWHKLTLGSFRVIFVEGWMVGFESVSPSAIAQLHSDFTSTTSYSCGTVSEWTQVNGLLGKYTSLWQLFHAFVVLTPDVSIPDRVFEWRLQQEQQLWQETGKGMQEGEVRNFVHRFLPCYVMCSEKLKRVGQESCGTDVSTKQLPKLVLVLDRNRKVVGTNMCPKNDYL